MGDEQETPISAWAGMLRSLASEMKEALLGKLSVRMALFEWHRNLQDLDFEGVDKIRLLSFHPIQDYKVYQQYMRRRKFRNHEREW